MGVNRAGFGIVDDGIVREAGLQEIVRRYFRYACEHAMGLVDRATVQRIELLMEEHGLTPESRRVVGAAGEAAMQAERDGKGSNGIFCGAAMELPGGTIIKGSNSPQLHAASSLILKAAKHLAGTPEELDILPDELIASISYLKKEVLDRKRVSLDAEETLIALGISAAGNGEARAALAQLRNFRGCEVHMMHMPSPGDEAGLRKLGVNLTTAPRWASRRLFPS
jgi:uncharacterized protein (UPF0371 family)